MSPQPPEPEPLLAARGIRKGFGGTIALDDVDFDVRGGEIHALLGENGAGKSTLVRILSGVLRPDVGRLLRDGRELRMHSPLDAFEHGIAVVHQELSLLPNLTVAENLCVSAAPVRWRWLGRAFGLIDRKEMRRRAEAAARLMRFDVDPNALVGSLSPARRQLVEIAKALMHSMEIILLDEPTSSLLPDERHHLFERLADLREREVGIVFITHLLEEALAVSDRITVLRDGKSVATRQAANTVIEELVELMTGRPSGSVFPSTSRSRGGRVPRLAVEGLASGPEVIDVSFDVGVGEIVGLAGLVGSGRTETLQAVFGLRTIDRGQIAIDGVPTKIASPREAIRKGTVLIPEDRQAEGLFSEHSVAKNICIIAANTRKGERVTRLGGHLLDGRRVSGVARRFVGELQIKTDSIGAPVAKLSGGNQQKVILARCLAVRPTVVLADEPTRGVAIGSKIEIYRLFRKLAQTGAAIVLVSSEFEELVGLCERIVLMRAGRTVGEASAEDLDDDALLHLVLATT